jgi:hypothetical protein
MWSLISKICYALSATLFFIAGGILCAYVYDVEYVSPEKRYQMDRYEYDRRNPAGIVDFPSFQEWVKEEAHKEARLEDYISVLTQKIGEGAADTFDWTRDNKSSNQETWQDRTSQGRD